MNEILEHLVENEDYTLAEAKQWIREARQLIRQGADPEELLYEIGLEPDFALDLMI